jgi:hypothetical protein
VDAAAYCREIETYLCRKNDGHLIRIVGPAFERVSAWAARGVPIRVVYAGVDRCFARYYARGPRRRPVRIEYCEADVLDVFDEWRRALGLTARDLGEPGDERAGPTASRQPSLSAHIDRAIERLSDAAARRPWPPALAGAVERTIDGLNEVRARAHGARGTRRREVVDRLAELDTALAESVRRDVDAAALTNAECDAMAELATFRDRMPADVHVRAVSAATDRLLRQRFGLPDLRFRA